MKCLFVDIASHNGLIACSTEQAIVSSHACDTRISDADLLPFVEQVLKDADWSYSDLTHVACVVGPGGFTSLRVAAAFTNTLASELKIPSAAVHLADLYGVRSQSDDCLWLHSTKKTQLFAQGFGGLTDKWSEPVCIDLEEATDKIPSGTSWMGELIEHHQEILKDHQLTEAQLKPTADVLPEFLAELSYDNELVLPWYGREW